MSKICLEVTVLSPNLNLENLSKFDFSVPHSSHKAENKTQSDPFYSLLIKHQLNLIQAWNPIQDNKETNIDTLSLSKLLVKLKNHEGLTLDRNTFGAPINSRLAVRSYELVEPTSKSGDSNSSAIKNMASRVAKNNDIPKEYFRKLIQAESGFKPSALSSRGAMGLGQIMPKTAEELGLFIGDDKTPGSVWHPESNLDASGRYLKKLYDKYRQEGIAKEEAWSFAAGAYNAGMGNISKAINKISHEPVSRWDQVAKVLPEVTGKYSEETIRYVEKIRA